MKSWTLSRKPWKPEKWNWQQEGEAQVQRGIFQGDALSPLPFIIAMMPLNYILRKCTVGYKLCKSLEKSCHLIYMDVINLFVKIEKELKTLIHTVRIYSQDIGMEFGIEKCAILVTKSGKRPLTDGTELSNQDLNARRKRNLQILGHLGRKN